MEKSVKSFAVVTGASSGIGYELAKQFAQHNYDLLIAAEDEGIRQAAQALRGLGAEVEAIQVDLRDYDEVDRLWDAITASGRELDAIAINAGVGVGGSFLTTSLEEELAMIDLNVKSVVHLSKHVLADMTARNRGKILYTASVVSEMPAPFQSVYSATKAFVLNFVEGIRSELKDTDITITALLPGATETNFFHRAGLDDTKVGQSKKDDPADVAKDGFEALMNGDDQVIAHSMKSKAMGAMGKVLPDKVNAGAMRGMNEPGSASKH